MNNSENGLFNLKKWPTAFILILYQYIYAKELLKICQILFVVLPQPKRQAMRALKSERTGKAVAPHGSN
jgi:hypothetical protein